MIQRHPFQLAFGVLLGLFTPAATFSQQPNDKPARPNIIFVMADDMGYGDTTCFNKNSRIKTPNMDRLASQGMRFTDAHTGAAICTPTRYNLLTGRYAWRTGLRGVLTENNPALIGAQQLTVAGLLKRLGYHTACIGKWHLGMVNIDGKIEHGPITRGFDYFYGFQYARGIENQVENDRPAPKLAAVDVLPAITKKAVAYLDQRAKVKTPFFLYLPLSSPHTPIVPAREFQGKSGLDPYGDFIVQTDWTLGQVMETLDRHDLAKNTLIIFTSDNGSPHAKGKGGHDSNHIFRGQKAMIYEGGHRVPFIARWPGKIAADSTCPHVICLGDLLATSAALVGEKLPENTGLDSVSYLPHLLGTSREPLREATVHHDGYDSFAIRKDQWVLVFPVGAGKKAKKAPNTPELYDLAKDIGQTKNLGKEHPEIVADLTRLMQRYVDNGRSTPGPVQRNDVAVKFQGGNGKKK